MTDALINFNYVTGLWNGTGFRDKNAIANGFFRGEDLSLFLYVQKVLNVQPNFTNGYTLPNITVNFGRCKIRMAE